MDELIEVVMKPTPPDETKESGVEQDPRSLQSPTQVWLRRVAFLLAAAAPALGCSGSGSKDVCAAYASKMVACDSYYANYSQEYVEQMCDSYLVYASQYGAWCHAAFEDYYACISHLSCTQIENGNYDACSAEENQIDEHCDYY